MSYDYFYGQSGELFSYFRIPKALFQDSRFRQLSTDARTLYGILLDRMSLSAKNNWLDEQGRVYIIYTVREVQESLCCAEHKAVKLFRELEQANLIERKRRGLGRPSLIYVKNFSSGLPPKAQVQNCANSNSCAAENAVQVQPKPQSNKTDKNKTERNNPFLPDESDREQLEDYFYQALEVELLLRLCPDDEDTIYQIVDLLVDTCSTKRKMLRIAGDDKPTEVVRSRLKKLNADHIRFVLGCLAENTSPVRNMKQYLLAALFNAPTTMNASEDNMLCVTNDGRKIGLDVRLMNPILPDDPNSKLNTCVRNVLQIWADGKEQKLTQLLFCDLSTPKNDGNFNVYDDIRKKLVAAGVPESEVEFIQDNIILRRSIKQEKESMEALVEAYSEQRKKTHDFQNQLSIIYGLALQEVPNGKVVQYVRSLLKKETIPILVTKTGRNVVDILLTQKHSVAVKNEIDFQFQLDDLSGFPLSDEDLIVVLSNLIDNALNACKEIPDSRNRTILLKMRTTEVAGFLYLENSTARDVEIRDNRIVLRETGSLEHGYGLKNVMAVLDCMDALYVFDYRQSEHLLSFSAQFSIAP